ncbi:MAG: tetratricopeptide repeat protein [Chloroflexi bacterium]|uniref:Tetratricopeptide repeat protein n=1 Tax=Candidatus Chlorohelix allophototropha TaxID=3003348 RepID=A0A8T7M8Q1_9CHLR|nr:tetratricopeptide repeat protein [Chloroflexota bacterium]WJW68368.1 tetratricopeptide repeat protein [Chloroflexota bacterium L227-S17]
MSSVNQPENSQTRLNTLNLAFKVLKTGNPDSGLRHLIMEQWKQEANKALLEGDYELLKSLIVMLHEDVTKYPEWQIWLDHYTARMALQRGVYKNAAIFFNRQIKVAEFYNAVETAIEAQVWLAEAQIGLNQPRQAESLLIKVREISLKHQYFLPYLRSQNRMGLIYFSLGDQASCRQFLEVEIPRVMAFVNKRTLPDQVTAEIELEEAFTAYWLGRSYSLERKWYKAINLLEKCLKIYRQYQNRVGISNALLQIGVAYYLNGEIDKAVERFEEGEKLVNYMQGIEAVNDLLYMLAQAYLVQEQPWKAYMTGRRALLAANHLQDSGWIARCYFVLGEAQIKLGETEKGQAKKFKAAELFPRTERNPRWIDSIIAIGDFLMSQNDNNDHWEQALDFYRLAGEIVEDSHRFEYLAPALGKMARAFLKKPGEADLDEAERLYRLQLQLAGDLDSRVLPVALAVQIRVEALTGIQCCNSLRLRTLSKTIALPPEYAEVYRAQ